MNITSSVNQQQNTSIQSMPKFSGQNRIVYGNSNVNFKGSKSEQMLKLVEQQIDSIANCNSCDVLAKAKFAKFLDKALPDIMAEENFINRGIDSKVYRISDKYVAKVKRGYYENNAIRFYHPVSFPNQKFKDIDIYYGAPVIKVGHVDILKNATPHSDAIYAGVKYEGKGAPTAEAIKKYNEEYLPTCASLPQESFDELAENLKKLNEKSGFGVTRKILVDEYGNKRTTFHLGKVYYLPDYENPNNWLISDGKFKIVDDIRRVDCPNPNSLYTMVEPLLVRLMPYDYTYSFAKYNPNLVDMRGEIFNKCLTAAKKAELPSDSPVRTEYVDWFMDELLHRK